MKELPKLYGLDSKGGIKEWYITVEGDTFTTHFGKLGGKITPKVTKVKGKNIGRSNETSPEEQAILEATSKWNKQKDKSYCEDVDNIQPLHNPMLAYPYEKYAHKVEYPCYVSAKLDGLRCLAMFDKGASEVVLKSRGGKVYPTPEHLSQELTDALTELSAYVENPMLDGELYKHGLPLNEIVSAGRKPEDSSHKLSFHVFDVAVENVPYIERQGFVQGLDKKFILPVKHIKIESEEEISPLHDKAVRVGYEGVMIKNAKGLYKFDHRSSDMLKYKEFKDAEWKILDVVEYEAGLGKFICDCPESTDPKSKEFDVVMGSLKERKEFLDNKEVYIGKDLTVKYQAKTKYNKPQFPVGIAIRDYE